MLRIWLECPRNALLLGTDRPVCCGYYQDGPGHCVTAVPVLCCGQGLVKAKCSEKEACYKTSREVQPGSSDPLQDFRSDSHSRDGPDLIFCPALGINSVFIWTPDVHGLLRVLEGFSGM